MTHFDSECTPSTLIERNLIEEAIIKNAFVANGGSTFLTFAPKLTHPNTLSFFRVLHFLIDISSNNKPQNKS